MGFAVSAGAYQQYGMMMSNAYMNTQNTNESQYGLLSNAGNLSPNALYQSGTALELQNAGNAFMPQALDLMTQSQKKLVHDNIASTFSCFNYNYF